MPSLPEPPALHRAPSPPQTHSGRSHTSWSAAGHQMIGAGQRRITHRFTDCRRRSLPAAHAGGRPCWSSMMESVSFHPPGGAWFCKVGAAGGIYPAGMENQMTRVALLQRQFTGTLGFAINVQRAGRFIFLAIMAAGAVEHIVRGIVHHQGTQLRRLCRQHRHPLSFSRSESSCSLSALSTAVCAAAFTTTSGRTGTHGLRDAFRVRQVTAQLFIKIIHRDHHVAEGGQGTLQLPAHPPFCQSVKSSFSVSRR